MKRRFFVTGAAALPLLFMKSERLMAADIPAPQSGKGLVVFYRPKRATGAALRFEISTNGGATNNLQNGRVMFQHVAPGSHNFLVSTPSFDGRDQLTLNVAAGQTLFVQCHIRMGWPAGRAKFTPVAEAQGRADVAAM